MYQVSAGSVKLNYYIQKCLLSIYPGPDIVIGADEIAVNEGDKVPCPQRAVEGSPYPKESSNQMLKLSVREKCFMVCIAR